MGQMDDYDGLSTTTGEATRPTKPSVRVERAGILGLTSCKFDDQTGAHISTTRLYEPKADVVSMVGLAPGMVIDVAVSCPFFGKCASCPNADTVTSCDTP